MTKSEHEHECDMRRDPFFQATSGGIALERHVCSFHVCPTVLIVPTTASPYSKITWPKV